VSCLKNLQSRSPVVEVSTSTSQLTSAWCYHQHHHARADRASERAMPSTFSLASERPAADPIVDSSNLGDGRGRGRGRPQRGSVVGSCRIADRSIRRLWAPEAGAITGQRAPLNENIRLAAPPSRMKLPTDSQAHLLLRVRIYTVQ